MKFVVIEGANLTLAEGQSEYDTIKVRRTTTVLEYPDGSKREVPCMTLELKPEAHEIADLMGGGSLFLNILGMSWPPVSLTTYDPTLVSDTKGNA